MAKPVPPKEQPRQASPQAGASQASPTRTPASSGSNRTESKAPMPQVSRAKVIDRPPLAQEQIASRAYQIWEERGRPEGMDRENWFEAERQLRTGPDSVSSRR
jgi:DUF2934 family protein